MRSIYIKNAIQNQRTRIRENFSSFRIYYVYICVLRPIIINRAMNSWMWSNRLREYTYFFYNGYAWLATSTNLQSFLCVNIANLCLVVTVAMIMICLSIYIIHIYIRKIMFIMYHTRNVGIAYICIYNKLPRKLCSKSISHKNEHNQYSWNVSRFLFLISYFVAKMYIYIYIFTCNLCIKKLCIFLFLFAD